MGKKIKNGVKVVHVDRVHKDPAWTTFQKADSSWSAVNVSKAVEDRLGVEREEIFINSIYTVAVQQEFSKPLGVELTHLSIKRNDKAAIHDWRDLQRIKNELCGPEREGLELYPAESRLVDSANSYHLYVLPPGNFAPFGWTSRLVMDGDDVYRPGQPRQRPWPYDSRPKDLVTQEQAEKMLEEMEKADAEKT